MDTIQIGRTVYTLDWSDAKPPAHTNGIETVCGLIAPNGRNAGWVMRNHPSRTLFSNTAGMDFRKLSQDDRDRLAARFGA